MLKQTINVEIHVGYDDVQKTLFATEYSILDKDKLVYTVENKKIRAWLEQNNLNIFDIKVFGYISGMFKPYGSTAMPATMTNVYTVTLKCIRSGAKKFQATDKEIVLTSNYKSELLNLFVHNYSLPDGQELLKKMYRTLALKYHPDKAGGNPEIMKYLNELKSRYLK
jgi:hypothetical protein